MEKQCNTAAAARLCAERYPQDHIQTAGRNISQECHLQETDCMQPIMTDASTP